MCLSAVFKVLVMIWLHGANCCMAHTEPQREQKSSCERSCKLQWCKKLCARYWLCVAIPVAKKALMMYRNLQNASLKQHESSLESRRITTNTYLTQIIIINSSNYSPLHHSFFNVSCVTSVGAKWKCLTLWGGCLRIVAGCIFIEA